MCQLIFFDNRKKIVSTFPCDLKRTAFINLKFESSHIIRLETLF